MVGCAVKLGDGPFEPLILLAIAGPVPKNTLGIRMNVSTGVFYDGDDDNTFNPIHR